MEFQIYSTISQREHNFLQCEVQQPNCTSCNGEKKLLICWNVTVSFQQQNSFTIKNSKLLQNIFYTRKTLS